MDYPVTVGFPLFRFDLCRQPLVVAGRHPSPKWAALVKHAIILFGCFNLPKCEKGIDFCRWVRKRGGASWSFVVVLGTGSCCWQLTHVLVKGKILRKLHHQCYGRECFSLSPSLGRRGTVDGIHWWDGPSLGFLKEEDVKETSARPLPPNGRWAGISSGSRSQATLLYCQSGKRRRRRCFGRLVS